MKAKIFSLCSIVAMFLHVPAVSAQTLQDNITAQIDAGASRAELGTAIMPQVILAQVVQIFLGFLATLFLVLMLLSGYWFITARGDEGKAEKAISTIRRAIIGFTIVMMAYALTSVVSNIVLGIQN